MTRSREHLEQWSHNRAFLQTISPAFPDWIVTVTFYVALQAVDALLAHDKAHITSHDGRNQALIQTNRYKHIWKHYQQLYSLARTVRYLANPSQWVPYEMIDKKVIRGLLSPIEESVQKLSGLPMTLSPIQLASPPATGESDPASGQGESLPKADG